MTTEAVNLEIASRMPWLYAESESIWSITGTYGNDLGTFTDCLAMVLPFDAETGVRLFVMMHPNMHLSSTSPMRYIWPDQISQADRLVLVHADEPQRAYFADEQDLVEAES